MIARPKLPTFALMASLVVIAFLLGGGSRHDIVSLAILRPLACLAAAAGLLTLDRATVRATWPLFALLAALALLMAVQLIPSPPSVWSALPGREAIAELDAAAGLAGHWRPLTLSPMKTANALAALSVPFAALVLFVQLSDAQRERILVLIVGIAVASAVLGVFQQLAAPASPLFLYEITNRGSAVGLFANRNHHAVFLGCALLVALYLAQSWRGTSRARYVVAALAAASLLFVAIVANGSRAGLICLGFALSLAAIAVLLEPRSDIRSRSRSLRRVSLAALIVPALALFGLFAAAGRSPALSHLLGDAETEEYRALVLPYLLDMARDQQPWGAGFGAFEYAFRMREPVDLMQANYLNNAHNDWLQWIIEGGVGAIAIGLAVLTAIAVRIIRLPRRERRDERYPLDPAWLGAAVLALLAVASVVDYPVRVPSIMVLAIVALVLLFGDNLAQDKA